MTEGLSSDAQSGREILIRGGRVYDPDADIDDPPVRDILIRGSRIVSVTAPDEDSELKREIASFGDEAQVTGQIEADIVVISGQFNGDIFATADTGQIIKARIDAYHEENPSGSRPPWPAQSIENWVR